MGPYSYRTRKIGALVSEMSAGATSATLASGVFDTPVRKIILTIDGDVPGKEADFECTVTDTAITNMVLLNGSDIVHSANATVWAGLVDDHLESITNTEITGWVPAGETLSCATNSVLTASTSFVANLNKGDKIWLLDDGVAWMGYVVSKPNTTTFTVLGGTTAGVTTVIASGSVITAPYYSKSMNATGFPDRFTYTVVATGFAATPTTYGAYSIINHRVFLNANGTGTSNSTSSTLTLPINSGAWSTSTFSSNYGVNADSDCMHSIEIPVNSGVANFYLLYVSGVRVIPGSLSSTGAKTLIINMTYEF